MDRAAHSRRNAIRSYALPRELAQALRRAKENVKHQQDLETAPLTHQSGRRGKTESQHHMTQIIQQHPVDMADLLETFRVRYLPTHLSKQLPPDTGSPNPLLDEDLHEVTAALSGLCAHTAPGMDQISNKVVVNLDDQSLLDLTKLLPEPNMAGYGILPEEWKTAEVHLIPKPGKPPSIENLRPISLTSCKGKLLEHIILNRLQMNMQEREEW